MDAPESDRTPPDETLLTAQEVADMLKVSVRTVRRLDLPVVALGKRMLRYRRAEVLAWLAKHHGGDHSSR